MIIAVVALMVGEKEGAAEKERMKEGEKREGAVSNAGTECNAQKRHTRIINTGMLQPIKYLQSQFPSTP